METLAEKRKKIPTLKLGPFKFVMGALPRITVTGAGSAVNGTLAYVGDFNGRNVYANGSVLVVGGTFYGSGIVMEWVTASNQWKLGIMTNGVMLNRYSGSLPATNPWEVVTWNTSGGSLPVPTVVQG